MIYTHISKVVERDSAIIASPSEDFKNIEIYKDHAGLNKCVDKSDPVYKEISAVIDQVKRAPKFLNYVKRGAPKGERYLATDILVLAGYYKAALTARIFQGRRLSDRLKE
jgi:hypothetical protein